MNEITRTQAERAALVQRFQLDALHRALQSLEGHLDALESESDRQRDELSRLERKLARLRDKARPAAPLRPGTFPSPDEGRAPTVDRSARHSPAARPGRGLGRVHAQCGEIHRRSRDRGRPGPPRTTPAPASRSRHPAPVRHRVSPSAVGSLGLRRRRAGRARRRGSRTTCSSRRPAGASRESLSARAP